MLALENADEILEILDRFTKQKSKDIPPELEDYISYVAKTGDTVYRWPTVQYLFREKLRNVTKEFHDTTASIEDLQPCPNVDQFNYESMKTLLFERFDNFHAAPFTIQRLCELLTDPKKHYSRIDKFMRALEKNILVVSTVEPGRTDISADGDVSLNGDILSGINIDAEVKKREEKRASIGTPEKRSENDTKKPVIAEEGTSSGSTSQATSDVEMKDEEKVKVEEKASNNAVVEEKKADSSDAPKKDEVVTEAPKPKAMDEAKPAEQATDKPAEENVETAKPSEAAAAAAEVVVNNKPIDKPVEVDPKAEITPEKKPIDEQKDEEKTAPEVVEKQPTPKHARSTSDDDEAENTTALEKPVVKRIRLELDADIKEAAAKVDPEPSIDPLIVESDLQKESKPTEPAEVDVQKEEELLKDAVDSPAETAPVAAEVVAKKEVGSKPPSDERVPTASESLKTDEPVAVAAPAGPAASLDFTPDDEALNELVAAEVLSVIPEQPAEEVKMSEESSNIAEAPPAADEMAVESNEAVAALEAESAMEAAPIKPDEEQMDVDESNSVDAMDL